MTDLFHVRRNTSIRLLATMLLCWTPLHAQGWIWDDNGLTEWLECVHFADSSNGWIAGYNGTIFYTTSVGVHWTRQESGTDVWLNGIYFTDRDHGWVVGYEGTILSTTNGGRNWNPQASNTNEILTSVQFLDQMTGWIVGRNNTILRTTDGGSTWVVQSNGAATVAEIHDVTFVDENNGWAVGDGHEVVFHTTDGGTTWSHQSHPAAGELLSVDFSSPLNGWSVGWHGNILHTTDGGSSWQLEVIDGMIEPFLCVNFVDDNHGWIVGSGGVIYQTLDGGGNWVRQFNPAGSHHLSSVYFADPGHGYAVGRRGVILRTTTGGDGLPRPNRVGLLAPDNHSLIGDDNVQLTWGSGIPEVDRYWLEYADDSLFTNATIDSMLVDTTALIGNLGENQSIWWRIRAHNATGWGNFSNSWNFSVLLTAAEGEGTLARSHALWQNYPNPFNPTTTIGYRVEGRKSIVLKVYDVAGREVATLVNETQGPGTHEVTWDAAGFASGVYLYRLFSVSPDSPGTVEDPLGETFTQTRKLMLQK